MPCWNGEKYLREAVDSVITQTYENWELIFVDNGSTDSTGKIIDEYARKDFRIRPIHIGHLDTVSKSRNAGVDSLTGDYTQLLDSDDYVSPDLLEKCYNRIMDDGCDIVLSDVITFDNQKKFKNMFTGFLGEYDKTLDGRAAFKYSIDWQVHGWMCAKSEIVKKVRFDTSNFIGDEFSTRVMLSSGQKIGFVDSVYYYRYNPLSTGKNPKNFIKKMTMINNYSKLYDYSLSTNCDLCVISKIIIDCYAMLITFYIQYVNCIKSESDVELKRKVNFFFKEAFHLCNHNRRFLPFNKQKLFLIFSFDSFHLFRIYLYAFKFLKKL